MDQLNSVEQTSQDATHAVTDEQAKDLSNQGFDTPSSTAPAVALPNSTGVVNPDAAAGGMPPASEAGQAAGSPIEPSEPSTSQSGAGVQPGQEPTPVVAPAAQTPADQAVIDNDKQISTAPEPTPQPGPTPSPSDFDVQQNQSTAQSPPLNPGTLAVQPEPTPQPGPAPQPTGPNPNAELHYDNPGNYTLTPAMAQTLQDLSDKYYSTSGSTLTVTSGSRDPKVQANLMYNMLEDDPSELDKYRSRHDAQVNEIINAYESSHDAEQAKEAMAKVISDHAASGDPISNHLNPNGAADVSVKDLTDKQKIELFKTCQSMKLHCIYEVPPDQVASAKKLVKGTGISVFSADAEHLHVDAASQGN
jgi:hypothetical protein